VTLCRSVAGVFVDVGENLSLVGEFGRVGLAEAQIRQ
jgi:hypothetical protein